MKYENQEKLRKELLDRKELEKNLMTEYINAESWSEFMLNCAVKYGWGPKNVFNKYWWHYKITDIGKNAFFAWASLGCVLIGLAVIACGICLSGNIPRSGVASLIIIGTATTIVSPVIVGCLMSDVYGDFDWRLKRFSEELEENDSKSSNSSLSGTVFTTTCTLSC